MTREEKQKAIDTLKISVPIMALTQEEFKDYIQTLNRVMDWLEQEPKSEWEHDHVILKAYSDGANEVLDKIRAEIIENSIEDYKYHGCGTDELIIETSEVLEIIDKYRAESENA